MDFHKITSFFSVFFLLLPGNEKKTVTLYYFVCHSRQTSFWVEKANGMNRKNAFCPNENEKCCFKWAPFISFFSEVRYFFVRTLCFALSHANATLCHFRMGKLHNFCRAQYVCLPSTFTSSITTQSDRKRPKPDHNGEYEKKSDRNIKNTCHLLLWWPLHWMEWSHFQCRHRPTFVPLTNFFFQFLLEFSSQNLTRNLGISNL